MQSKQVKKLTRSAIDHWGYERLRDSLSEKDYDVIIIHTPHWATFVGTHFLGVENFKSKKDIEDFF